jgi:hypothetical protein
VEGVWGRTNSGLNDKARHGGLSIVHGTVHTDQLSIVHRIIDGMDVS